MKKVLGIGNALTDLLLQVSEDDLKLLNLPKGSMQLIDSATSAAILERFKGVQKAMVAGGSASNTINGIACMGGTTAFIGKIGHDEIGKFYTADTQKNGVRPLLLQSDFTSGHCVVLITPDGERTMCTCLGAACSLNINDLQPDFFVGYDIFHIEGYLVQNHELIETAAKMAKKAGMRVSIDLASYNVVEANRDFLQHLITNYVDIVFANEEESHSYTGLNPEESLCEMAKQCEIAIVKVGKNGSYVKRGDETIKIAPIKANCIDTTGAGDLYAAGFLYGLANDYDLERCGNLGALVSGKVVEFVGPKMDAETWNEIKKYC